MKRLWDTLVSWTVNCRSPWQKQNLLLECISRNDAKRLKKILSRWKSALKETERYNIASMFVDAVMRGQTAVVHVLVQYGLDGGAYSRFQALSVAVNNDDIEMCEVLLGSPKAAVKESVGASSGFSVAQAACQMEDSNGEGLVTLAALRNSARVIPSLVQGGCQLGKLSRCRLTPLQIATRQEHLEVQQMLLQHGADSNQCDMAMMYGYTPIELAIISGNRKSVQNLITAGCKIKLCRLRSRDLVKDSLSQDPEIEKMIVLASCSPRSLRDLCRMRIRAALGSPCWSRALALPLPAAMIEYIQMCREFNVNEYKLHLKTMDLSLISLLGSSAHLDSCI